MWMCSEVAGAGGAGTSILLWTSNRAAAAHVENEAEIVAEIMSKVGALNSSIATEGLDDSLKKQYGELLYQTQCIHSLTAPIRRLPKEILLVIFSLCMVESRFIGTYEGAMLVDIPGTTLAQVCALWSALIKDAPPSLWSALHIDLMDLDEDEEDEDEEDWGRDGPEPASYQRLRETLQRVLEKSGKSPLCVTINIIDNRQFDALSPLLREAYRWKHLYVSSRGAWGNGINWGLQYIKNNIPLLETVAITDINIDARHGACSWFKNAPSLKSFTTEIASFQLPWSQIQVFDVGVENEAVLLKFLPKLTSLQKLVVHCRAYPNTKVSQELKMVLPLSSLKTTCSHQACRSGFLKTCSFPNLFELEVTHENYSNFQDIPDGLFDTVRQLTINMAPGHTFPMEFFEGQICYSALTNLIIKADEGAYSGLESVGAPLVENFPKLERIAIFFGAFISPRDNDYALLAEVNVWIALIKAFSISNSSRLRDAQLTSFWLFPKSLKPVLLDLETKGVCVQVHEKKKQDRSVI
jgi:hypothetical protein